jgi:hypothetical protein
MKYSMRESPLKLKLRLLVVAFAIILSACEGGELTIIPLPNPAEVSTITATVPITRIVSIQASEPLKTELSPEEYQLLRVLLSQQVICELMKFTATELQREGANDNGIFFRLGVVFALLPFNEPILKETYLPPLDVHAAAAREQQMFLLDLVQRWLDQHLEPEVVLTELSGIDPGATLAAYEDYLQDNGYLLNVIHEAVMRLDVEIFGPPTVPHH